jgi:peptide/nickel transport system substrate-binding protein
MVTVDGNSMAARMSSLVNPDTKQARDGAITRLTAMTVKIKLSGPDITIIINMADYPAAVVHPSFDGNDPVANPIGTGPYLPESFEVGVRSRLERQRKDHTWWGTEVYGGPIWTGSNTSTYGSDPSAHVAAAGSGEIDMTYSSTGDFIQILDGLGWEKSEAVTASTLAVRFNQDAEEYKDVNVRRGIIMAVDNRGAGTGLQRPWHRGGKPPCLPDPPRICRTAPPVVDKAKAKEMMVTPLARALRVRTDLAG